MYLPVLVIFWKSHAQCDAKPPTFHLKKDLLYTLQLNTLIMNCLMTGHEKRIQDTLSFSEGKLGRGSLLCIWANRSLIKSNFSP